VATSKMLAFLLKKYFICFGSFGIPDPNCGSELALSVDSHWKQSSLPYH